APLARRAAAASQRAARVGRAHRGGAPSVAWLRCAKDRTIAASRSGTLMRSPDDPADASSPAPKLIEGKHAIIAVFVIALAGALGSWWYHGQLQRRAISLWGGEVAELIQTAPRVELLKLEPANDDAANDDREMLDTDGLKLTVVQRRDLSGAAGLIHLRH